MFVSTRAFSATGLPTAGYTWEFQMPKGVQVVDGPDENRKAVREQVKYGADWIKVYATGGTTWKGQAPQQGQFHGGGARAIGARPTGSTGSPRTPRQGRDHGGAQRRRRHDRARLRDG